MIVTGSETQQRVSARRSLQVGVAPLERTTTLKRRAAVCPLGQIEKCTSVVLFTLEADWLLRRASALQLATSSPVESITIVLGEC